MLAFAAVAARSVALAGFGLDSLIEIGASTVVIWELSGTGAQRQRRGLRLIGYAFGALAGYLFAQSTVVLVSGYHPRHSAPGIVWTALTAAAMFALAAGKARTGRALGNPVLRTEGRVTMTDGILATAVLAGLALNAGLGWWWADPLAGYVLVGYAAREVDEISLPSWARQRRARFSGWCPGRCGGPQRSGPGRAPAGRAPPGTCPGLLPDRPGWPRTRLGSLATSSPTSIRGASTPPASTPGPPDSCPSPCRARLHRLRLAGSQAARLRPLGSRAPPARLAQPGRRHRRAGAGATRDQPYGGAPADRAAHAEESQQAGAPLHPHPPQDVIPTATAEAAAHCDDHIGTGHLLLALFRADDAAATQVLAGLGAGESQVRGAITALLDESGPERSG